MGAGKPTWSCGVWVGELLAESANDAVNSVSEGLITDESFDKRGKKRGYSNAC